MPAPAEPPYEFLTTAAELALEGRIDAITTLPLNKQALHQSGVSHPGHTEILAECCGVADHAMMLYLETNASVAGGSPAPSAARHRAGRRPRDAARRAQADLRAPDDRCHRSPRSTSPTRRCGP